MKKILYFYPENPLLVHQGNNARANKLLHYFKSRNITVDYIGVKSPDFQNNSLDNLNSLKLINSGDLLRKKRNRGIHYLFTESIPNKIFPKKKNLFSRLRYGSNFHFNNFIKNKNYDYIIISYAYWMPLVIDNPNLGNAKIIVDTHDFLTAQFKNEKGFDIGQGFKNEINILKKADIIWAISDEENYLFSQFISKPIYTIRHGLEDKSELQKTHKYDLIYVASNNNHNLKSAKWFFEKVYPLLSKEIKICVVGRVNEVIKKQPNITQIKYIENLDDVYRLSKICICPMLSGTGVKIKVIEALSHGLPVICNTRGLDGLPSKFENGCIAVDNEYDQAKLITKLLADNNYYSTKVAEGISFFNKTFNTTIISKKLDEFFLN